MRSILVSLVFVAAAVAHAEYDLLVTQTPAGNNPPPYFGVLRYRFAGPGAGPKTGIAASDVVDPAGLALSASGELFVGNRNGNTVNPGGGSVSRFLYDVGTDSYVPNGSFAVNQTGTHGVNFSPTTGELFAANLNGPVSRFNVTPGGATPNGSINAFSARDVLISPDGQYAYVTQGISGDVVVYDVATGAPISGFSVPNAGGLHFGSWLGNSLYVADVPTGNVFRLTFAADGSLATSAVVTNEPTAISVAFSPNGLDMYVAGHTSGVISHYITVAGIFIPQDAFVTGVNMGDMQIVEVVPEPASLAALGLGLAALARRRRK